MQIFVQMKTAGKRKPILSDVPYEISDSVHTLREFLTEIVQTEVAHYNAKETGEAIFAFLTQTEIEEGVSVGKVGFGRRYSEKKADPDKAVANALQCFSDGLVRVFQNEEEREELDALLQINEGDYFTFIRLAFLAGRLW